MLNLAVTVVVSLIGIVITFYITKHYYNKSINKSIVIYRLSAHNLTQLQDDDYDRIQVIYDNQKVCNISKEVYLIANDGNIAITNLASPLSLKLKGIRRILHSSIRRVHPMDRQVKIDNIQNGDDHTINLEWDLLNPGDYIALTILNEKNRYHDPTEVRASIACTNLSPIVPVRRFPYSEYDKEPLPGCIVIPVALIGILGIMSLMKLSIDGTLTNTHKALIDDVPLSISGSEIGLLFFSILSLLICLYLVVRSQINKHRKPPFIPSRSLDAKSFWALVMLDEDV